MAKKVHPVLHCHEVTAEFTRWDPQGKNIDVDYLFSLLPGQRSPYPAEAEATAATVCFFLSYLAITVNGSHKFALLDAYHLISRRSGTSLSGSHVRAGQNYGL